MKVYNIRKKTTWSWNFLTREAAEEAIKKGHNPRYISHLVVLEDGEVFEDTYINFGDFARKEIGMQCQYASHYLCGLAGYRNCGIGLRYTSNDGCYHSIMIHKDDAQIFKKRLENSE